jgi:hypothetical protein
MLIRFPITCDPQEQSQDYACEERHELLLEFRLVVVVVVIVKEDYRLGGEDDECDPRLHVRQLGVEVIIEHQDCQKAEAKRR